MACSPWMPVALLALGLTGCAGYRLGPTNGSPAQSRSVEVRFFQNATGEPRISEAVAQALRQRLQQEGTFRLATRGEPDIIVHGVLTRYSRSPLSYQPSDVITVRDYEILLEAHVTAEECAGGRKLLDQAVRGRVSVRVGHDEASAERQALPVLAEDLARNITSRLADGEW